MKVFCIALEGSGPTGVDWYHHNENRDDALGKTGAEIEITFDLDVDDYLTSDEITAAVDNFAWNNLFSVDATAELEAA